jgi:glutamate formiminotransferase/formiminotetrahydrofolate cyclodeaminase
LIVRRIAVGGDARGSNETWGAYNTALIDQHKAGFPVGAHAESDDVPGAEHALQLENFRRDQVLELRLKRPPLTEATSLAGFLDDVAAATPTPGGGTVSAIAGAMAACLTTMVTNLSIGKKKYAAHADALRGIKREGEMLRRELMSLGRRDSEAFDAVLRAAKLPQATPDEVAARERAAVAAGFEATRVPLATAGAALRVAELAAQVAKCGNVNAISDAGVAGLLARAAGEGALLNVQINLKSLPQGADKQGVEMELHRLQNALVRAADECARAVASVLGAS